MNTQSPAVSVPVRKVTPAPVKSAKRHGEHRLTSWGHSDAQVSTLAAPVLGIDLTFIRKVALHQYQYLLWYLL